MEIKEEEKMIEMVLILEKEVLKLMTVVLTVERVVTGMYS
jgi:hypothetical protein